MNDRRGRGIVAASFVAGLVCAGVVVGPNLSAPAPAPYFGLDADATTGGEPPPPVAASPALDPAFARAAAVPVATNPAEPIARAPVGDLSRLAAALASQPPERLAIGLADGPVQAIVAAQVLVASDAPAADATPETVPAAAEPILAIPSDQPGPAAAAALPAPPPPAGPAQPVNSPAPPTADDLKALVARAQRTRPMERIAAAPTATTPGPAVPPLPDETWADPDGRNWADAAGDRQPIGTAGSDAGRRRVLFPERRPDQRGLGLGIGPRDAAGQQPVLGGRLLDRLRGDRRPFRVADAGTATESPHVGRWPVPNRLVEQLQAAASSSHPGVKDWAAAAAVSLEQALATHGPADPAADETLLALGDTARAAMSMADGITDPVLSADTRRLALAIERRVAVWRAASGLCAETAGAPAAVTTRDVDHQLAASQTDAEMSQLLDALERFEQASTPAVAASVTTAVAAIKKTSFTRAKDLVKAVGDHYLAPNVRVAVHQHFVERMLPDATVESGPMQDFVLGKKVRGTRTIEQSTSVRFVPDVDEIRFELLVSGEVDSRTVTEAGPVAIHSRGAASFTVRKPVSLSTAGLAFGQATGRASNDSRLAGIQTNFDGVPLMGPLMRNIARSQVDDNRAEAEREVNGKIIVRACREVDQQAEPKFAEMADRIRARLWEPLVRLGLDPQPVALETTDSQATVRLRLAAVGQLAAHTPRPRAPADAMLSMQVHQSSLNNACDRFELAGRSFEVRELIREVCGRIGVEPTLPDDMPEDVKITFAAEQPLRVECRDGLIHVRIAIDALESGRRDWYDIVAQVSYRPRAAGLQVSLEREGPVQLSGPNQQGRLEIPLRTIFGKIFPKERPIPLLPPAIVDNPRLATAKAVQTACADGWFALALAEQPPSAAKPATAALPLPAASPFKR